MVAIAVAFNHYLVYWSFNTLHTGYCSFQEWFNFLATLAKFQSSGGQRWTKLVVYDNWPDLFLHIFLPCLLLAFAGYLITLMSTYTGKPTLFMNVFPKCFTLGENTLFHHFRIFCYKQQKHEATGLLGPGCALTYVNIYEWQTYVTHIL